MEVGRELWREAIITTDETMRSRIGRILENEPRNQAEQVLIAKFFFDLLKTRFDLYSDVFEVDDLSVGNLDSMASRAHENFMLFTNFVEGRAVSDTDIEMLLKLQWVYRDEQEEVMISHGGETLLKDYKKEVTEALASIQKGRIPDKISRYISGLVLANVDR